MYCSQCCTEELLADMSQSVATKQPCGTAPPFPATPGGQNDSHYRQMLNAHLSFADTTNPSHTH